MGVWEHMWVARPESLGMSRERVADLCADLLAERLVRPEWSVVSGRLGDTSPLGLGLAVERHRRAQTAPETEPPVTRRELGEAVTVEATGTAVGPLVAAITAVPDDGRDFGVYFPGLDLDNRRLANAYPGISDPEVAVLSLAEPTELLEMVDNPDFLHPDGGIRPGEEPTLVHQHQARSFFSTYQKGGPDTPQGPLLDVLIRHLGAEALTGCAFY
ncbi:hypothetical protein RM844_31680 [Streptomyces sp. DSM 44915]|uniref:Uncharacterized protein n=1 Tax=Streptomyces chisholmiae TaxID=3075540 RepID=A0ABU2K0Q6_9ACTN|nr:hypothetical protein [Streptomyces sp. DSM 44915]MDT0270840.1 hypothetical protein [Streptomyces sp. DSM 44915]